MHSEFKSYMAAHVEAELARLKGTAGIRHPGAKGKAREALAAALVRPWFGPAVQIGNGFVIDSVGKTSLESDNVLYWPDVQPVCALGGNGGPGYFPVEGVAAVMEVKSRLTTHELRSALANLQSSCGGDLGIVSGSPIVNGQRAPHNTSNPFGCLLAFDSDVALLTLRDVLKSSKAWALVCALGKKGGVFVGGDRGGFKELDLGDGDVERLLVFSAILRDNIQDTRVSRGTPGLSPYVGAPDR